MPAAETDREAIELNISMQVIIKMPTRLTLFICFSSFPFIFIESFYSLLYKRTKIQYRLHKKTKKSGIFSKIRIFKINVA